jgi:hypothetical protein
MKLEKRSKGIAITNECCPAPYGYVRNGRVTITTSHKGEPHMLVLMPDDLRKLAEEAERSRDILTGERAA